MHKLPCYPDLVAIPNAAPLFADASPPGRQQPAWSSDTILATRVMLLMNALGACLPALPQVSWLPAVCLLACLAAVCLLEWLSAMCLLACLLGWLLCACLLAWLDGVCLLACLVGCCVSAWLGIACLLAWLSVVRCGPACLFVMCLWGSKNGTVMPMKCIWPANNAGITCCPNMGKALHLYGCYIRCMHDPRCQEHWCVAVWPSLDGPGRQPCD